MRTISFKLPDLLTQIRSNRYAIPQFQRDFIWSESQVKLLIDSIARNYPIGSLLVLEKNENIKLHSRVIEAEIENQDADLAQPDESEPSGSENSFYVLDGQQRLTSIARVFLDGNAKRVYYLDLKEIHDIFDKDPDDLPWIRTFYRKKSDVDRREKNRYLRADVIFDQQKSSVYVQEYIEDSGDFGDDKKVLREATAKILQIFETIRNYQLPVIILDSSSPLDSICRVFETINSTGTRLTTFDLAVARFFPDPDLRELYGRCKLECETLRRFEIEGERLLQVIALWDAINKGRYPEATRGTILKLESSVIKKDWDRAVRNLEQAYRWAEESTGAMPTLVPNHGILVAIGAFLGLRENGGPLPSDFWNILRRWYFSKCLQQGARQATNYRIGLDFSRLRAWHDSGNLDFEPVHLAEKDLVELRASDVRHRSIQCLMSMYTKEDMLSGKPLSFQQKEEHHIYPASLGRSGKLPKARVESVVNKMFVSKETNRNLADRPPCDYLSELGQAAAKHGTIAQLRRRLNDALLPPFEGAEGNFSKSFALDQFQNFTESRAKLILDRVQEVIGDSLHRGVEEESEA